MTISTTTAKTLTPVIMGLAAAGTLPRSEAKNVAMILKTATIAKQQATPPPTPSKEKMLTAKQAATRLGITSRTLYHMKSRGLISGVYLTGSKKSLRFRESDIEAIMAGKTNAQ